MKLDLSPEELADWRNHRVTKLALAWMEERIGTYRRDIPEFLVRGKDQEARAASGALKGYAEVLAAFTEEAPASVDIPEEQFTDPAERLSLRETT